MIVGISNVSMSNPQIKLQWVPHQSSKPTKLLLLPLLKCFRLVDNDEDKYGKIDIRY